MDFNDPQPWKTLILEKITDHTRKSKDKRRTEKSRWHHSNMIKYFERLLIEYEQNEIDIANSSKEVTRGHTRVHSERQSRGQSNSGNNNK